MTTGKEFSALQVVSRAVSVCVIKNTGEYSLALPSNSSSASSVEMFKLSDEKSQMTTIIENAIYLAFERVSGEIRDNPSASSIVFTASLLMRHLNGEHSEVYWAGSSLLSDYAEMPRSKIWEWIRSSIKE